MKRLLVKFGFLLLILLLVAGKLSVTAEERLSAARVNEDFRVDSPLEMWTKSTTVYDNNFSGNLSLRLYAGFNQNFLFLGFYVRDSFLTFADDFTLDFQGSDHLRIHFQSDPEAAKTPVTLYLLPSSKIKEPLFNIAGASWRHSSITVHSVPGKAGYFYSVAIDRSNLRPTWQREIPLQIGLHDVNSQGKVDLYWLFGTGPKDHGTLVLSQ